MLSFQEYLLVEGEEPFEVPQDIGTAVMATGNMNPPTRGHLALAQYVADRAKEMDAPAFLFITKSHKGKGLFGKKPDLAGQLYHGTAKVKADMANARSPLSPEDKATFINRLFKEINKLDIDVVPTVNPHVALGELIKQGYTDIKYYAGSEYFEDPKEAGMIERMDKFVQETVNPGRKAADPTAPMVQFEAIPIARDPNATSGTESYKGSKARREIHGHMGGEYDEVQGKNRYSKMSGWESPEERAVSDEMFDRAVRSYRGE